MYIFRTRSTHTNGQACQQQTLVLCLYNYKLQVTKEILSSQTCVVPHSCMRLAVPCSRPIQANNLSVFREFVFDAYLANEIHLSNVASVGIYTPESRGPH